MKKKYDFSKAERGKFYNADAEFNLPNELKEEVLIEYVDKMADLFLNPQNAVPMTKEDLAASPKKAGVYCIYDDKNNLLYVGEGSCLSNRMRDLFKTRNHTFRRSLGKSLFLHCEDCAKASTTFCERTEGKLNQHCAEKLRVLWLPVLVGRKEIEEKIIIKYNPVLNKVGKK